MAAASYRRRLLLEGAVLAATGLAGSAALLAGKEQARRWPQSTILQLIVVAAAVLALGPRQTRRALAEAERVRRPGTGEPTPLWHVPAPVAAGALFVALSGPFAERLPPVPSRLARKAGWDAALRVTGGAAIVGLVQALLLFREVAREEARTGRTFHRLPGSRLGRGTRLGYTR